MTYSISVTPNARRSLGKLSHESAERIARAIDALASEPRPTGCKKLKGADELWRIRVGDYRVIYTINDGKLLVLVVRVGHRRDVYE